MISIEAIIQTHGLCKAYNSSEGNVLKDLDLEIYKGDFTVIMGRSGSGKSTLLYLLSVMDYCTAGNINLLGKDMTKESQKSLAKIHRESISFVFQGINLLPDLTLFENIVFCGYAVNKDKAAVAQKAEELLKLFELWDKRKSYPSEVSGGQQQMVAIARALINDPEIIFADEPTGALNGAVGQDVLDTLSRLNAEGRSIIMVTHDLNAAARASRMLYLRDGSISGELRLEPYQATGDLKERTTRIFDFVENLGW
ncbi:ABC transporter related protein [Ethanoligenens harbinense YUAN-3]|uniref:ABC transporter related protein n=1 Tax=Ethanoligenens harbinense (strain DSM 18485 / JCM 12961 / CGMCC 1.5033 / YUAN-3) TaxID=663278 RepID=E6U7B5_ETHHY|nr:ABC transporter related protein [Ethanoligenens harbinense YUAN-3]